MTGLDDRLARTAALADPASTPSREVEQWHNSAHPGAFQWCTEQPCAAVVACITSEPSRNDTARAYDLIQSATVDLLDFPRSCRVTPVLTKLNAALEALS